MESLQPECTGNPLIWNNSSPMTTPKKNKRSVGITRFKRPLTQHTTYADKKLKEQKIERELEQNGHPILRIAKMKKQANNKEEKEKRNGDILD